MARPRHPFSQELCWRLVEHMSGGLSFESFGAVAGCSRSTLYQWLDEFPEFKEARDVAVLHCQKFWEERGIQGLSMGKQFNAVLWIVNMSNRFGWHQRPKDEVPDDDTPAKSVSLTDEQLIKLVTAARESGK